jgi:hypothetical protein
MSRTRKRPYRKSRAFDASCRCHGGCPWCRENRLYQRRKLEAAARYALQEAGLA